MATLADGGRISADLVDAEIQRLQWLWQPVAAVNPARLALEAMLPADTIDSLDLFDRMQLEAVIRVCQESPTLSDAGRRLFDRSRTQRSIVNDADRLRKYLLKFQLTWHSVRSMALAHESR
jgi:transcriptional regulatory protein RtcR